MTGFSLAVNVELISISLAVKTMATRGASCDFN